MRAHLAGNIVRLLAPLAPHVADEWWSAVLGRTGSIFATGGWPELDDMAIAAATVTIVCQVNSKVRAQLTVAPDIGREELEQLALAEPKIQKHLEGKKIRQTIIVPRRLINFVVG
jgi:leucyl-tRNA synthetase